MAGASGREKIPPKRREEALERDGYSCNGCGDLGEEAGGSVKLHVHHADPSPDDRDRHALSNLTTYCVDCHVWQHLRPESDDVPFEITAADDEVLDPADYEILQYLAENGPAGTSEVADVLSAELSPTAVRERLAVLMGLDNQVEARDRQILDHDVETGQWGLTDQIEHSARGHIPSDRQTLIQRIEEEQVRKALARGYDQETVAGVLDVSPRTVVHKQKRAWGYGFPLDAFRRGGSGGQHPEGSVSDTEGDEIDESDEDDTAQDEALDASDVAAAGDAQQQLDAGADGAGDSDDDTTASEVTHDESAEVGSAVTAGELTRAIETLRAVADQVGNE
jgi:hypothetical protein